MSLKDKLKKTFNKKDEEPQKREKTPVITSKPKYKNMTVYAPPKTIYKDIQNKFQIFLRDEDNEPIIGQEVEIKVSDELVRYTSDEIGKIEIPPDFPTGVHIVQVRFPNGDYSRVIESKLTIKKEKKVKSKTKTKDNPDRKRNTSINAPKMRMYVNNESQYYVKLRRYNGRALADHEVTFTLRDEQYNVKTDRLGFARLDISNLGSGTYKIKSKFKGTKDYKECEMESQLQMVTRDIDKEVIIDVKNLVMEFKVTKDKIDTLKEFAIRSLKRNKEKEEKIRVIDDISFKVYKGDKLGILGFNGAGKSTLLKIMSGIYEPTSGSITTYGKIAPLLELGAGFDKNYTGKNNIYLNGALLSINEKTIKSKYDEIVEFSELGDFINYPIKNYSSGMRTKLGFSIATLINPDILIIDEILSVGDIKFRKKSADKINSMMQDGATVLLVSHSIKQIRKICDRCIWLENGKIKMEGDADDVCDAYVRGAKRDMKKEKKK